MKIKVFNKDKNFLLPWSSIIGLLWRNVDNPLYSLARKREHKKFKRSLFCNTFISRFPYYLHALAINLLFAY